MNKETWQLGEIIKGFRARYRLSKAAAAPVLGVSILYVRSLEEGVDVKTGLPFRPREATLRQLAAKMTEFGYPITFEELLEAAGRPLGAIGVEAEDEPGKPEPMSEQQKRTLFKSVAKGDDRPRGGTYPLTDEEWAVFRAAQDAGMGISIDASPGLLDQPPEKRRKFFLRLEDFLQEAERFRKLNG